MSALQLNAKIACRSLSCILIWLLHVALQEPCCGSEHFRDARLTKSETNNGTSPSQSAEALFNEEYPAALKKMDEFFSEVKASGILTITRRPPEGDPTTATYRRLFQFSGGSSKWEEFRTENTGEAVVETVWCRNPEQYVFSLERPKESQNYSIRRIARGTTALSDAMDGTVYRHYNASHGLNGVRLSEILSHISFRIKSIEYVNEGVGQLIHVAYTYSPDRPNNMLRDGELWLLPGKGWAIHRSRSDYLVPDRPSATAGMECKMEYSGMVDGVAVPKRVILKQKLNRFLIEEELVFESFEHTKSPDSDFSLPHYNLTEADVPTEYEHVVAPASRMTWLIVGNAVLLLLLFVIIVRRRQHAGVT